ncbi:alpha-hydroxy-acid oxidizing enzyme [Saccharothrix sp. ALI-22-I]|nr:alpha-hydroxy-acid oxidizing enzyme [Saccharothrix sp. ALI-22-I]
MIAPAVFDLAGMACAAKAVTPALVWDFVEGGSGRELSVDANRSALDSLAVVPRVLRGVSTPAPACTLLGTRAELPVAIAPMAYQRLLHPDGELAAARAAKLAGVPFIVPMLSSIAVETVASSAADLWFQLYWLRDRGLTAELLARAEAAGCRAVVLTVDVPRMGRRLRDLRNGFALPHDVRAAHFPVNQAETAQRHTGDGSAVADHTREAFDPALNWSHIEWLRARTSLPIVLKGLLDPRDALQARESGVDALVVSNHGGRQLDGALPAIDALPAVRAAVGDGCEVFFDSGVRSGLDVLRALASGAHGVLLGRPALHGLSVAGTEGLLHSLTLLRSEFEDAMVLSGCQDVHEIAELRTAPMPDRISRRGVIA